jgi:heme exporter protein B
MEIIIIRRTFAVMNPTGQIIHLIKLEARLEWKNRQAITSLIVYSLASIYISYLAFRQALDPTTWNALFWIIMLFAATNAIAKSFLQESKGLQLFYYTTLHPQSVILAKTIYNILLLVILGGINFIIYSLLFECPMANVGQYLVGLFLGAIGLSSTLTFISGLVSRANNNVALIAILGFPLLFPLLLMILKYSSNAMSGVTWEINQSIFYILIALNAMIIMLSYLLFPYLWRE